MLPSKEDLRALPLLAPLVAANMAPMSTLLDIPALTERWFFRDGNGLADPNANIYLNVTILVVSFLANGLLLLRFSLRDEHRWRNALHASLILWTIKLALGIGNVLAFGILFRNDPGISYGEGFWCAVVSLIITLCIVLLLLCHYAFLYYPVKITMTEKQLQVRVADMHFMLQTTAFVVTLGVLALYMSRIEHWTYFQGIYFAIGTILTIGFGDFYPTKPATQIALFPFALLGIIQLASLIDMIVRFFSSRMASRHARRRVEFERKRHEEEESLAKAPDLERELLFLQDLYSSTSRWGKFEDLILNLTGFTVFWILGALIFSQIEHWTFGQGLYFCYVVFLSIGFGDYELISPAGRVVFVLYAILAVPIIASFAVQTLENIFKRFMSKLMQKERIEAGLDIEMDTQGGSLLLKNDSKDQARSGRKCQGILASRENSNDINIREHSKGQPEGEKYSHAKAIAQEWNKPHSLYIDEGHRRIEMLLSKRYEEMGRHMETEDTGESQIEANAKSQLEETQWREDRVLTEYTLELAIELEQHARRLLLGHLPEDSRGHMLLKADRLVQLRNIRHLVQQSDYNADTIAQEYEHSDKKASRQYKKVKGKSSPIDTLMQKYYKEEAELIPVPSDLDERETLEEIIHYRESFANLLAAGSRLLGLKDEEQYLFERHPGSSK